MKDARLVFRDDPVVGREVNLPEAGRRLYKLDAHLGPAGLFRANVNDAALPGGLRGLVRDGYFLGRGDARCQGD